MELAIDRVSLLNSLFMVQGIVERRNTVPILGHVLLEPGEDKLKLSATDLEVGIRTEIAAETVQPGPLTLSARKLFEIVRETESEKVTLRTLDNDWFELRCGRARFRRQAPFRCMSRARRLVTLGSMRRRLKCRTDPGSWEL